MLSKAVLVRKFTSGEVAKVLGIDSRRVQGWVQRGLVNPDVVKGDTPHGDRREFDWDDLVVCGVLVELQEILGTEFRPGNLAELVVAALGPKNVFGFGPGFRAAAGKHPPAPEGMVIDHDRLIIRVTNGKPEAHVERQTQLQHLNAAIVIDLEWLGLKLEKAILSKLDQ